MYLVFDYEIPFEVQFMRKVLYLIGIYLICGGSLSAQELISSLKLEDFEFEDDLYPFADFDRNGTLAYVEFEPVALLEPGAFIQMWRKERKSSQKHYITRYNLLLEEAWTIEMELDWQEDILHMFHNGEDLMVLTYEYDGLAGIHVIRNRSFDLDTGEENLKSIVFQYGGKSDQEVFFDFSPDDQTLTLFYYTRHKESRRVGIYYDYIKRNHEIGAKVFKPGNVVFNTYNRYLELQYKGEFELPQSKMTWLDAQIDNQGNFYLLGLNKPTLLTAFCFDQKTESLSTLTYERFVERQELNEAYFTHFPPTISGHAKRIYIAHAEREIRGKLKGTQAFQIVSFDFDKEVVDLSRRIDINSSLLVTVEKQREDFGVPPLKRFDGFMIQEIIEMPDERLWLITQKFDAHQYAGTPSEFGPMAAQEHVIQEVVMYEFEPNGEIRQALIVPSYQRSQNLYEKAGEFYSYHLESETGILSMMTREPSGDKLRGPDRLYTRMVNLNTSEVSNRKLVYEGQRRTQYFLRPYTVWHNNFLVSFVVLDGEQGEAWLVSVNLLGEPSEEKDEPRAKARRN
ncbi:MAG: hypothetical protein AB8H47_17530 [Bacteroidia bacterium]